MIQSVTWWRRRHVAVDVKADLRATLAAHGWAVVNVPDDDSPFHYTVGLSDHDLPELIVFGCDARLGHNMLNDLAARILDGQTWSDGEAIRELIEGDVALQLHTATSDAPVGMALFYYERRVAVRQLVLPDGAGLLPWESGAQDPFGQPLLFDPHA